MSKHALGLCVSLIVLSGNACLAHSEETTLAVQLQRQQGPTCLVAAAITAASARGLTLNIRDFTRRTAVFPEGVHPYDLAATASKFGLSSLIFTGPPQAASRLIRAGFAPIAFVKGGTGRHALVVTGVRQFDEDTQSNPSLYQLKLADPARNLESWESSKVFASRQSGQQMIVLFKEHERAELGSAGFPTNIAVNMDAQFRAETLYRRALKHGAPNRQMKALLQKALKWHPCHKAARALWSTHNLEPTLPEPHLGQCESTQ